MPGHGGYMTEPRPCRGRGRFIYAARPRNGERAPLYAWRPRILDEGPLHILAEEKQWVDTPGIWVDMATHWFRPRIFLSAINPGVGHALRLRAERHSDARCERASGRNERHRTS